MALTVVMQFLFRRGGFNTFDNIFNTSTSSSESLSFNALIMAILALIRHLNLRLLSTVVPIYNYEQKNNPTFVRKSKEVMLWLLWQLQTYYKKSLLLLKVCYLRRNREISAFVYYKNWVETSVTQSRDSRVGVRNWGWIIVNVLSRNIDHNAFLGTACRNLAGCTATRFFSMWLTKTTMKS